MHGLSQKGETKSIIFGFISSTLQSKYLFIGGAGVVAQCIPSYGPVYPYKGGSGPAGSGEKVRPHPLTAHVISGQSGGGTMHYWLCNSHRPGITPILATTGRRTDGENSSLIP